MLARPSRSRRQHPGQSLSFCSAHVDAQFNKTWRRTSVDKLNQPPPLDFWKQTCSLASLSRVWTGIHDPFMHLRWADYNAEWTWHCRRPENRTEKFVWFGAGRTEHSDGFSERCAIIFRLSHPAAARFRWSFQISVCKSSLLVRLVRNFGLHVQKQLVQNQIPLTYILYGFG